MRANPNDLAARAAAAYRTEHAFGVPFVATRLTSRIESWQLSLATGLPHIATP